jgi:adenosylcobinamide kinase/adenosylcobinamide-phosphate guanylyltransferase
VSTTLVLGGARSGKSDWAVRTAAESGRPVLFLATATAGDDEMAERIARHRAERPADWRTIEEPIDLVGALRREARPGDLIVVDCLTLWVSNLLLAGGDPDVEPLLDLGLELILVSNEVGLGLVPDNPLGRAYRDVLGQVNRAVAARAESVVFMVAGLPVDLRRLT